VRPIQNATFINNTVYSNGNVWGGGFFNENPDAKNIVIRNNIFSQNLSAQISDEAGLSAANLTVDHNLIDGYREDPYETRGSDYVEGEPMFVNVAGADFHLQKDSPAVDKGSSVDAPNDDFEGNSRPQDGNEDGTAIHDIGAYEVSLLGVPPPATAQEDNPPDQSVPTPAPATEEPAAEEPATEEPSAEAGLVDGFEDVYEPDQGWEVWVDEQTDSSLAFALDNEVAHSGSASLRIEFDIAPEGSADASRSFDPAQDWSDGTGLAMWLRFSEATEGDQGISVILDSGEPEAPTPFEAWLEISPESADPSGWILVELPWDRFPKADWADEGGLSELDPSRVAGIGLSFDAPDDSRVESIVWVDDIRLLGETPQPAPTEAAPVAAATATAAPMTAAPTPPEEEEESRGLCPISMGLALTGLALARKSKARPE
jgi:hypothetical protein